MCTLTYIPVGKAHYLITSNRDESGMRAKALPPEIYLLNNNKLIYPKDPVGGGSWIATSENGLTACLLNGAYKPHITLNSYKKSRGLIVLDLFNYKDPIQFSKEINLKGVEPFTLVMIKNDLILEMKWTGKTKNIRFLETSVPHIWVSEQLYSKEN
ncbi:MAG: NRDE family protein, partial [Bacteroidia bacterium]